MMTTAEVTSMPQTRSNVPDTPLRFNVSARIVIGLVMATLLIGGIGGWSALAQLSGAVVTSGVVSIDENIKSIQHRDGGIVSQIAVREGDGVEAGDILIRLDDAQTKAELSIAEAQLIDLKARRARLIAERDGLDQIALPADLTTATAEVAAVLAGEVRLFNGNVGRRKSQQQQLELNILQTEEEIKGLDAQRSAKSDDIALVRAEYDKNRSMADRGLIERSRLYSFERELARLNGELGGIDSSVARANARISETRLQIMAVDEVARNDAQRELGQVETKMSELIDRIAATTDRLTRTDIRAPISGTVNELNVHTIGGVVTPAEVLLTIVPKDAKLNISVKLSPSSIDQVTVDQPARLRFPTFNQRVTPELNGKISFVSPAATRDPVTGEYSYLGYVQVTDAEIAKLGANGLLPGMPVEVYVTTQERTVLSYLVKPLVDRFSAAFRER